MNETTSAKSQVGLCADCCYTREIVSGKGSRFFYCVRSETDERYAKYPRLPVLSCPGYQAQPNSLMEDKGRRQP
jgi:hypothetical protein